VDSPDQTLGDRRTDVQVRGHEVDCLAVVQKLPCIFGIGLGNILTCPQPPGLLQGQSSALDVRGMVSFQHQCLLAHLADPVLG